MPDCRFAEKGCTLPAIVLVALERGCVCFPLDRQQALCIHHDMKSTPLGSYVVLERYHP